MAKPQTLLNEAREFRLAWDAFALAVRDASLAELWTIARLLTRKNRG